MNKEQIFMSKLPDFALLEKIDGFESDFFKSKLANVYIKILRISRLYELDGNSILCFCNYYSNTLKYKL